LSAASMDLPSGMQPPNYQKANPNDDPLIAMALTSNTQSAADLYNLADSLLAQRLRQVTGVASVDIAGASTPAVRVDVNLRALNAMGLSPDDLRNALRAANVVSPTGFISDGKIPTAVIVNDAVAKAADFANLAISSQNGVTVRLKDVARVYDGQQDAYQAAWFNKKPAVVMYTFIR
ncbi:efflux RND transporter permease subunit, partial [Escherichia coli]|nr:efflux RND transporter permease subunit [Escherichia coli]